MSAGHIDPQRLRLLDKASANSQNENDIAYNIEVNRYKNFTFGVSG